MMLFSATTAVTVTFWLTGGTHISGSRTDGKSNRPGGWKGWQPAYPLAEFLLERNPGWNQLQSQQGWRLLRKSAKPARSFLFSSVMEHLEKGTLYESLNIASLWKLPIFSCSRIIIMPKQHRSKKVWLVPCQDDLQHSGFQSGNASQLTSWKFNLQLTKE